MEKTYVCEVNPLVGLSIYDQGKLIGKETYNAEYCNLCGKPVKKYYAVIHKEEDGIETDVTINREGALCKRCAVWDMKYGLVFDENDEPIKFKRSLLRMLVEKAEEMLQ